MQNSHISNLNPLPLTWTEKKNIFFKFIELGAIGLTIDEFVDLIFLNFHQEIEQHLVLISQNFSFSSDTAVWLELNNLIERSDFDHPFILALHRDKFLREIGGSEYSILNRYPEVYAHIIGDKLVKQIQDNFHIYRESQQLQKICIGIIGTSYGQELITVLKLVNQQLTKSKFLPETVDKIIEIDVFNKPNIVFEKLTSNIMYPQEVLMRYLDRQFLEHYFLEVAPGVLVFSNLLKQQVKFNNLDLLSLDDVNAVNHLEKYDLLLVHNVLQYLEPQQNQSIDIFEQKLLQAFDFFIRY
ncbi:hypothetical protein A0J48_019230 [Sphaerospermopsis aphanizomenoides BCCUSP55]|uniref:CheR family methyltransferase n=1 Tax=Sphaerospermopsis aphanizomenoides TaxID=459663 RepID=UPI0019083162|nr:CheR family methyltransferase [Sphaerospermopsis aphanizomenoides]MBK1989640.1 hypothetical protein [Sphaerospermopsis aphanizomenoides BCCUSP55]